MLITTDARKHARTHARTFGNHSTDNTLYYKYPHKNNEKKSGNRVAPVHCLPDDFRPLVGGEGVRDVGWRGQTRDTVVHTALLVLAGTRPPFVANTHHMTGSAAGSTQGHLTGIVVCDWTSNPSVMGFVTCRSVSRTAANLRSERYLESESRTSKCGFTSSCGEIVLSNKQTTKMKNTTGKRVELSRRRIYKWRRD